MCELPIFYYSLNMNDNLMPTETCIHKIIKYVYENSIPYAKTCVGACFMNFVMFLSHFIMYTGGKSE